MVALKTNELNEKGRNRRGQILDKASLEFSRRGYHATSVADIIDGLGIARGTFYQYFANKRAIFEEIVDGLLKRVSEDIRLVVINDPTHSPKEQLVENITRVLERVVEDRATAKVLLSGGTGVDAEFDKKVDEFYSHVRHLIKRSLVRGREMGLLREIEVDLVANCALGCLKEVVGYAVGSDVPKERLTKIAESLLDVMAFGIFIAR